MLHNSYETLVVSLALLFLVHIRHKDQSNHITSHHTTPHHITPHHTTPRHAMATSPSSRHVTSRHVTSRHVTSRHVTSRHVTSRHVTSRHVTSHQLDKIPVEDLGRGPPLVLSKEEQITKGRIAGRANKTKSLPPTALGQGLDPQLQDISHDYNPGL